MFFFILLFNEILIYITFNHRGSYAGGVEIYKLHSTYDSADFLSHLNLSTPFIYNLIIIVVNSLYAGIISVFTYSLSLIVRIRSLSIIAGTYIGIYLVEIITVILHKDNKFSMNMYQQGGSGDLLGFLSITMLWLMIIGIIFAVGLRKDTV